MIQPSVLKLSKLSLLVTCCAFLFTTSALFANSSPNHLSDTNTDKDNWAYVMKDEPKTLYVDFAVLESVPYKVHIFNQDGRLVYHDDLAFVSNASTYSIELDELKSGNYLISVSSVDNKVFSQVFTMD